MRNDHVITIRLPEALHRKLPKNYSALIRKLLNTHFSETGPATPAAKLTAKLTASDVES